MSAEKGLEIGLAAEIPRLTRRNNTQGGRRSPFFLLKVRKIDIIYVVNLTVGGEYPLVPQKGKYGRRRGQNY